MGWAKSSTTGRKRAAYQVSVHAPVPLREPAFQLAGDLSIGEPSAADTTILSTSGQPEEKRTSKRNRRVLPVYDVATGQDLETPVNLDNTLLQAMFPDLAIAMGQVPPPPPCPRGKDPEVHMQEHWAAVLTDLSRDLGAEGMALDIATGSRKEGRFMFTDGQVGRMVADTHEKIMAYGGLLASPCLQPPKHVENVRVLVVKEGEMGTGDCAGKVSRRLATLWGKDGSEAGQFRLGVRLDEDTILVGKGTLKAMDLVDVDAEGRGYDLILPDSSFKGNCPAFGEHTWDVCLGFNAWSTERRTRLSYQILQWFDPELVEQCIFPRANRRIPVLQEAMKDRDSACKFLRLEREDREAEVVENERGEMEAEDAREPSVLEQVLLADTTGQAFDHPYVQNGLRRRLREAWHELAVGGGVKVPSFMGLPDSFRGAVDWLPEGCIVCPDLPPGEVLATRYPIRTRHDVQVWRNLDWDAAFKMLHEGHPEMVGNIDPLAMRSFFRYAERHKGVAFMSHGTAKRVGGDFDGDVFQVMPVTPHKPLAEIKNPNRDWSDLAPLVDQVRREGWGEQGTTPKVKRRLATHVAPERAEKVTEENRKWLASAAIHRGGHREQFLVELGHHLDGQHLDPEKKQELAEALSTVAGDWERSLDEAVEIAEAHGFDSHAWFGQRERDLFDLARQYNREQAGRQALKNMDSALGQIVYTVSRVNASDRYTPEEREQTISRLAEVDKFKYDTGADMAYVNEVRKKVGRELVWLDVHKDPNTFVRETRLSHSQDAVSHLWNHVSREFRSWERAPEPPAHFKEMLPAEFSRGQYAVAKQKVKSYNRAVARAMQGNDDKAMVSAIQGMEEWSNGYTDPQERRVMAQAVWHAAHESTRPGGTASAAFHAFQPEILSQLQQPQSRPACEVLILGSQHENNLGKQGVTYYDKPRTIRIRILLEAYTDTYGRTEQRMAAYELDDAGVLVRRIGYLPKNAPRREASYLATLNRPEGKRRIEGRLSPLNWSDQNLSS